MPDAPDRPARTAAQRSADHAELGRLAERLVPALVTRLGSGALGEVEVREGDWRIRVRRPAGAPVRRPERLRGPGLHVAAGPHGAAAAAQGPAPVPAGPRRETAASPAVGIFRAGPEVGSRVRAGDPVGRVDMLGIPQDVPAPIDGTLVELLVAAGEAVEYGEALVAVEADPEPLPAAEA